MSNIKGLKYTPDAIDEKTSGDLLTHINAIDWSVMMKRYVKQYGKTYYYKIGLLKMPIQCLTS